MRGTGIVAILFLGGCTAPIKAPVAPPPSARDAVEVFARLVNQHRQKVGCKPFTWVGALAVVAQKHSEDMFAHSFFSHVNPAGKTPFDRLQDAGIRYRIAAENIAAGQQTAEQVLQSWLGSPGHRRNIENCELTQHGVGLSNNRWTHVMVTLVR
jgi:uncharacterized protein YkwD